METADGFPVTVDVQNLGRLINMANTDDNPEWEGEDEILMGDIIPEYPETDVRPLPECTVGNVDAGGYDDWE